MQALITGLVLGLLSSQPGPADRFPGDQFASAPLGEVSSLQTWIALHPGAGAEDLRAAWSALCDAEARVGRYSRAREACQAAADLRSTPGLRQSIAFWSALSDTPPIEVRGAADVPMIIGWPGLGEIAVTVGDQTTGWIVDTGAEVSLMSASDALRLGVRMLDGDLGITGSTPGVAVGRIGVLDALSVGDAVVAHIPVFVLPDEAVTVSGKGRLPPILGMPVFYAFGRVGFTDAATRIQLGGGEHLTAGAPIRWSASGIALELDLGQDRLMLHLDSGANQSELLASDALPVMPASLRDRASETVVTSVGVSGAVQTTVTAVEDLPLGLGGTACVMPGILLGEDAAGAQGRLGLDFIRACGALQLDFITMRAAAGPVAP